MWPTSPFDQMCNANAASTSGSAMSPWRIMSSAPPSSPSGAPSSAG